MSDSVKRLVFVIVGGLVGFLPVALIAAVANAPMTFCGFDNSGSCLPGAYVLRVVLIGLIGLVPGAIVGFFSARAWIRLDGPDCEYLGPMRRN
jgi:hypothetical protein